MTSLIFRTLDQHVVHGLADHLAVDDGTSTRTYAQLLAETAAFAGGLAQVGVREGSLVDLQVHGLDEIIAVLACARLGAIPSAKGKFRIDGEPPVVHTGEHDYPWATVLSSGKTDPAPAPDEDPHGYAELMRDEYEDIFSTLTSGETIS